MKLATVFLEELRFEEAWELINAAIERRERLTDAVTYDRDHGLPVDRTKIAAIAALHLAEQRLRLATEIVDLTADQVDPKVLTLGDARRAAEAQRAAATDSIPRFDCPWGAGDDYGAQAARG